MKKKVITILFIFFLISLILFSNNTILAAKEGLLLWANCVVPAVFPFCIAVELLNYTELAHILGRLLNKLMRPLFNVPGIASYALIMGIISSSPIGATITYDLYENNLITKNEAERLLAFTNNTGPLFIVGTTGTLLFGSKLIGYLLLLTHILACLTVGIILGVTSRIKNENKEIYDKNYYKSTIHGNSNDLNDLGGILSLSIKKSIALILQIGGFVVLFSVIISILNESNVFIIIGNMLEKFYIPKEFTKSLKSFGNNFVKSAKALYEGSGSGIKKHAGKALLAVAALSSILGVINAVHSSKTPSNSSGTVDKNRKYVVD
jgi:sporulation integral membrane protein YlbJ